MRKQGKKANFGKFCENFKIVDGDQIYKEKRRVVFDNTDIASLRM